MKSRIKTRGYYRTSERLSGFVGLGGSMVLCLWLMVLGQGINLNKQKVEAKEYTKPVVVVPKDSQMTEKQQIMNYIVEVFGDDSMEALKIAECESRFNPETVGDTHLMSINNQTGELIGDSIGIFQVRTGDTDWNRAKANGLTVDEFRAKLKDFRYNIDYAKTIYDKAGSWKPWFNCMNKVLN